MDTDCLVVRNAIASIFSRKELAISTTRTEQVKIYANELLCTIDGKEYRTNFEKFSVDLLTNLKSTFQCSKPATVPKLKEKVWIQYVEIRANKLPVLWNTFLSSISCPHLAREPLLTELINEQIMEGLLTDTFKVFEEPLDQQDTEASAAVILSKDEENVLRYACGYVVKKLLHEFVQQDGDKAAALVECIARMQSGHEDDKPLSSFVEYTNQWTKAVNRGGLFEVHGDVYLLFREIEASMQLKLKDHLKNPFTSDSKRAAIIDPVLHNNNVQFYWSILNVDIENDDWSEELLARIIELWLTMRGFSISMQWTEEYKRMKSTESRKKKGLRKELKKMT